MARSSWFERRPEASAIFGGLVLGPALRGASSAFWLRAASRVGQRAVVAGRPHVANDGTLRIGDDFRFASRPARSHLVTMAGGTLEIGHRVSIAHGAAISAQLGIRIGDDVRLGPFVVIMDSDFHVAGDRHALAEPSPVHIGNRVTVGGGVTILRGSTIGDDVQIESGSVVGGNIPEGAQVGGVPARVRGDHGAGGAYAGARGDGVHGTDGAGAGNGIDVTRLVMRVLGLSAPPQLSDGPQEIPQWDSLGALKLLLAMEETWGVSLAEDEMAGARSVEALGQVLVRAQRRAEERRIERLR